jgi:hypothetical protein
MSQAIDPEEARVMDIYQRLGDQPPEIDIATNDAAYGSHGAHTEDRHGLSVPLQRDPDPEVATVRSRAASMATRRGRTRRTGRTGGPTRGR